jgi:predicted membrane-bound spermidine synthase
LKIESSILIFLFITIFIVSFGVILFELTLTRIFSIILWYDYAFMAISVAFFGLGIGAFSVYVFRNKKNISSKIDDNNSFVPTRIVLPTITFAISIPIFLLIIAYIIPPSTTFIYLFYLAASIPFFFAGISLAWIYVAMPNEISKLYFVDLIGAAIGTLALDPMMQLLGAETTLLLLAVVISVATLITTLIIYYPNRIKSEGEGPQKIELIGKRTRLYLIIAIGITILLTVSNIAGLNNIVSIEPGENKILHYRLADSSFLHIGTLWNSFSRVDVTEQPSMKDETDTSRKKVIASILIDADADTPIYGWNGSISNLEWIKGYMDFLPYEMSTHKINHTVVIGSGGGGDVLVALAGGAKNVTAVELNPSIVTTVKKYGSAAGNLYDRNDVSLYIDDGRRFVSSSNQKYDMIVIKLVDSWAAQLAGGYALSENYLYTVEAFREYLQHLDPENGILVMVRWNIELPRLLPLVAESLRQEEVGKSMEEISKQLIVVEDRPGLYFGSNQERTIYPVLVMVKNSAFNADELASVSDRVEKNDAKVIAIPGKYVEPPYDKLFASNTFPAGNNGSQDSTGNIHPFGSPNWEQAGLGLKIPTDDSPFYFAKELIPKQMILLLETVLAVSSAMAVILIYYSRINKIRSNRRIGLPILFAIFIGVGFIFVEITFIQKYLLLLGTPILALTVILFSILLSTGIGSYLSGRIFNKKSFNAIVVSIPLLLGLIVLNYAFLQDIITSSLGLDFPQRIVLTFTFLSPIGIVMGFQFPSITRIAYSYIGNDMQKTGLNDRRQKKIVTLLWGVNVIASVIGTVLAAISSMTIGFNGNLLIAAGLYLAALCSAAIVSRRGHLVSTKEDSISQT